MYLSAREGEEAGGDSKKKRGETTVASLAGKGKREDKGRTAKKEEQQLLSDFDKPRISRRVT